MDTFDDNQLFSLLDSESRREKEKEIGMQRALEIDRQLWEAVEILDITPVIGPDYSKHDEYYNTLFTHIYEEFVTEYGTTIPEDQIVNMACSVSEEIWTKELALLGRLQICMSEQQFPSNQSSIGHADIKKDFMADLIAEKADTATWFPLIDYVLTGDQIDIENADDIALIHEKVEAILNIDTCPQSILFDSIIHVFDIPEDMESISPRTPEVIDHINNRLCAGRDITVATQRLSDVDSQADRHEAIHAILRTYRIDDTQIINAIIALSDAYTQQ